VLENLIKAIQRWSHSRRDVSEKYFWEHAPFMRFQAPEIELLRNANYTAWSDGLQRTQMVSNDVIIYLTENADYIRRAHCVRCKTIQLPLVRARSGHFKADRLESHSRAT